VACGLAGALVEGAPTVWAGDTVPTPPTLMLHSRHRYLLPRLLDALSADGYEGITFSDLAARLDLAAELPPKPVIITIDDLSLVHGNPSYETFCAMKDALVERGWKGVFSVVTGPHLPQDDDSWQAAAAWAEHGIELVTHGSYHSNLDNEALTDAELTEEIGGSADMIRERTGQPVPALVTPFGSGYSRAKHAINPRVVAACQQAGIRFVVGIVEGRAPLDVLPENETVYYLGRVPPGIDNSVGGALYEVAHWIRA
jgi:peptidoglycan/xylan/chitin deacetylase (PgdA/CDA1 family)